MKLEKMLRAGAVCFASLLASCMIATAAYAVEESQEEPEKMMKVSGDYTYAVLYNANNTEEKAASIESYSGSDEDLVIPAQLDGIDVVALGDYAFTNCGYIRSVSIPETVESIGKYTFAESRNIESYSVDKNSPCFTCVDGVLYADEGSLLLRYPVGKCPAEMTLKEGLVGVGNSAFACCPSLTSVTFPESLEYIGVSAFAECTSLKRIEIPAGVEEIAEFAFNNCLKLEEIKLNKGLKTIGAASFINAPVKEIELPDTLETVGEQAFCNTLLKEVTIPKSVTEIGYSSFGWYYEESVNSLVPDSEFVIYGEKGSTAESYATDFEDDVTFKFVEVTPSREEPEEAEDIAAEATTATEDAAEEEEKDTSGKLTKIIGLSVCGVLLVIIAVVGFRSGRKKEEKPEEKKEATESAEEKTNDEESEA